MQLGLLVLLGRNRGEEHPGSGSLLREGQLWVRVLRRVPQLPGLMSVTDFDEATSFGYTSRGA